MNSPTTKTLIRLQDFRAEVEAIRTLYIMGDYSAEKAMIQLQGLCERDVEQAKRDAASMTLKVQAEIRMASTCSLCGKASAIGICEKCAKDVA